MKKLLTIVAVSFIASAASAEAPVKIGVVDIQKIMAKSLSAKSLQDQLESKKNDFQNEIKKQEEDLQKEDKKLGEQRNVLAKEAFEKKVTEFKQKVAEVQRKVQTRRSEIEHAGNKALAQIQENAVSIIADIAKQKGLSIVVPSSQILYSDSSLNISDEVLSQLDKKLPKVSLVIEKVEGKKKQ